jgi:hypothetical protein
MTKRREDPVADKEQAEGSRRTVDEALEAADRSQQGVTNRSVDDEKREQEQVPPRGAAKPKR